MIFCSLLVAMSFAENVQDAVRVNVERHLDLRHASRPPEWMSHFHWNLPSVRLSGAIFRAALQDVNLH